LKKTTLTFIAFIFLLTNLLAQFTNNILLQGYGGLNDTGNMMPKIMFPPGYPDLFIDTFMVPDVDIYPNNSFDWASTLSWGDTSLLILTNGCRYYLRDGSVLPGSEFMAAGYPQCNVGETLPAGFFIPWNDSIVDHVFIKTIGNAIVRNRLQYHPDIDSLEVLFYNDTIFQPTESTLYTPRPVRHGNGRDWWIYTADVDPQDGPENKVRMILLTQDSVAKIVESYTGDMGYLDTRYSFSPDGKWMVRTSGHRALALMQLDRCSGQMWFVDSLPYPRTQYFYSQDATFSPDSRYLYASNYDTLWRYKLDVNIDEIESTQEVVGGSNNLWYEFPIDSNIFKFGFAAPFIGRNGKIYIPIGYCGSRYMSVIHDPNSDTDPQLDFQGIDLKLRNGCKPPVVVEYGLFDAPGCICDTLSIDGGIGVCVEAPPSANSDIGLNNSPFVLMPNPATDEVIVSWVVDHGFWPVSVDLTNSMGILIQKIMLGNTDKMVVFDLTYLPMGIYYCKATMSNGQIVTDILTIVK
jgi:hypothetical protein